jgi:hypothetical protein
MGARSQGKVKEHLSIVKARYMQQPWWLCALLTPALLAAPGNASRVGALGESVPGTAQPTVRSSNVSFSARVPDADRLDSASARSFRLYDEPDQIIVIITIDHRSPEVATADSRIFAAALQVSIKGSDQRLIPIDTDGTFRRLLTAADRVPLGANEALQIASGRRIEWELRLQRADGQRFGAGRHTIDLSLAGPFAVLRLPDGSAPRSVSPATSLTVTLGAPTDLRERANSHYLTAQKASKERRFSDAAAGAQRALDADPYNARALVLLGFSLMQMDRCPAAAAALEKVLQLHLRARSAVPGALAQAYICAGDEANARRVLGLWGMPAPRVDAEIARLRQVVERRGAQRVKPGV